MRIIRTLVIVFLLLTVGAWVASYVHPIEIPLGGTNFGWDRGFIGLSVPGEMFSAIAFPFAGIAALMTVVGLLTFLVRPARAIPELPRCHVCGYDLRASDIYCPECGHDITLCGETQVHHAELLSRVGLIVAVICGGIGIALLTYFYFVFTRHRFANWAAAGTGGFFLLVALFVLRKTLQR